MSTEITAPQPVRARYWMDDDGAFSDALITVVDTTETIAQMGLAARDPNTRTGLRSPSGALLKSGLVRFGIRSSRAIPRDARFRAAMDRVLHGTACPDFSLPPPRRPSPQ